MKRVIIGGATRIVGHHLIQYYLEQGDEVIAIVRPHSNYLKQLPSEHPRLKIIYCELCELSRLSELITQPCDLYYHLQWEPTDALNGKSALVQSLNIQYTLEAVKAAKALGCKKFIGSGSQAEYGIHYHAEEEEMYGNPQTAYGIAKYAAGKLSKLLAKEIDIAHIWVRIFSIYGPYERQTNLIPYVITSLFKEERPSLTACEQKWDFLYCEDAARALYLVGEKGKDQAVYNLGSGKAIPLKNYIEQIRNAINPRLELGIGEKPYADKQLMYLCADISRLTQDTGFVPQVSFEEGIRKTLKWYKSMQ